MDSNSVDLCVADPPYNIGKDTWDKIDNYNEWMREIFIEIERVLKPNGSFYFFHNDFLQIVELQNELNKYTNFKFKSFITIDKLDNIFVKDVYGSQNHFRNYLNIAEYCLFYVLRDDFEVVTDYESFKDIKNYFKNEKTKIEKELNIKLKEKLKWTTYFHFFSQGQSWNMITEEKYKVLQEMFPLYFKKQYEELKEMYEEEINNNKYVFNKGEGVKNVWQHYFRKDRKTRHSCEKPIDLISEIVSCSSNENDTVLIPFVGSGSECVSAKMLNRNYIGFEINEEYIKIAEERLSKIK